MIKIAVCIPTYNRADKIGHALKSLLCQQEFKFDVIVYDNCSLDNTRSVVYEIGAGRVRYCRNEENLGYVGNVNKCLSEHINYDWIGILHSDDIHYGESVALVASLINSHPQAGIIFSDANFIDEMGGVTRSAHSSYAYFDAGADALKVAESPIYCSTTFYNSDAIKAVGGYSHEFPYSADEYFNSLIAAKFSIVRAGSPIAGYRHHSGNLCMATWLKPDFISSYEQMRLRIISMRLGGDVAVEKARLAKLFMHCAWKLKMGGHFAQAEGFWRYMRRHGHWNLCFTKSFWINLCADYSIGRSLINKILGIKK